MKFKIMYTVATFLLVLGIMSCESEINTPSSKEVKAISKKVADWQIATFEDMGKYRALPVEKERKKWHNREKHHDLDWTCAALYAGMFEWSEITGDPKYSKWLYNIGVKNNWKLYKRMFHADDHAVGQNYLNMGELFGYRKVIRPLKKQFDAILASDKKDELQWNWCDALFMAPPVWTKLTEATGNNKYLEYMDQQYHKTYDLLWDAEEQLFFRDKSFISKKEKNGEKLFWSRGNGWVFGGLSIMIPDFPKNWEGKQFYVDIFQQMAQTLKKTQRKDGTWSSGLLGGEKAYPTKEISGSAFFVFGLAWGINNGYLNAEEYTATMLKGWEALSECVTDDGLVGYIQPIGAAPGNSFKEYTEVYGVGAFLAAGAEVYKYAKNIEDKTPKIASEEKTITFMKDGGWCWYQDPRAIINNGKLVIGSVSGQSGDVKVSVYDLDKKEDKGTIVLDKNFQVDDHDTPAFYARPDGSILSVWAKHASENKHYYSISSPENYLEWGEKQTFTHEYEGRGGVTYMNLHYLENEKTLYNFFRDGPSFNPSYITSKDQGKTWGNRTHFIADDVAGRQRPYARYIQKDKNTVGISFTDGHPRAYGNSLYYAEFRDGTFYNVDGTKIKVANEEPLRTPEAEKIYVGSETKVKPKGFESVPNSAWTCAMGKDANNNPHIGYTLYLNNEDHRFRIALWNGTKWIDKEIAYAGKCLYTMESSYTGLMAFDPEDPTRVYISTDVNPSTGEYINNIHEIYTAKIDVNDDISTIKWEAITANSEYRNIRPMVVSNEGKKVLIWLSGPWKSFVNYKPDVKGIILSDN
ncbi:glycoside hydrolase family 88 protein [Polaribacter sp. Z014]|uniref:glycoside hydrolase family 88 protein n=1 Tax=Polaribacter sp. Z014 TaxID=2927126 RepID=UPI0020218AC8|nr:glycoside hydrolase family 88 protein [Polaribacter sp. Z014]MCL7762549.1 glycoside hydrolase family 88 protein [Polaribacter sp. Z014]